MGFSERFLMTWDENKRRWTKMHKGCTYRVTCTELGVQSNKSASYLAANQWWKSKQVEIAGQQPTHHHQQAIDELNRRVEWAKLHSLPEAVSALQQDVKTLLKDEGGDLHPSLFTRPSEAAQSVWVDRLSRQTVTPPDRTIQALSGRFLALSATRVEGGELSASEHDLACRCTSHFIDWIGPGNDPAVINADRWEAYFLHLRGLVAAKRRSREYAKKDWRYAKMFVEWLASLDKIPTPKNLHSRRYRFGATANVIVTFTPHEARQMIEQAPGQLRLHLLLMLNCGFYQSDIADLRHAEIDGGYITRQRSKTRHHGDCVPTVSYRLWPVTLELLCHHTSSHKVLALTTLAGKSWVEEIVVDNRIKSRRDGIKSNYAHLTKRLKVDKPLKTFRKTSSSLLDGNPEFSRYAQFFLGHSGRTTAEKHYVKPDQEQFDRAIEWLRQQYGF